VDQAIDEAQIIYICKYAYKTYGKGKGMAADLKYIGARQIARVAKDNKL
jgi:UDPglucose 6-dehydrogenase